MLKIGIIGSGFGIYGLLPAFGSIKGCKVTCVCADKTPRVLAACRQFRVKNIYGDWREMLKSERLDAVAIAVVPAAQFSIARLAIKKGLHVFAEKPLALKFRQARELQRLAAKHKAVTAVDFIFPELPQWQKVKALLQNGKLGRLLHLKSEWDFLSYDLEHELRTWKTDIRQGGGALSFYFSHVLYYLQDFVGDLTKMSARLSGSVQSLNGGEVGVDMLFQSAGGIKGSAHLNCASRVLNRHRLEFFCEGGTVVLENNRDVCKSFVAKVLLKNRVVNIKSRWPKLPEGLDERVIPVKNLARRFIAGCLAGRQIKPSFTDGLKVQKLTDQLRHRSIIKV